MPGGPGGPVGPVGVVHGAFIRDKDESSSRKSDRCRHRWISFFAVGCGIPGFDRLSKEYAPFHKEPCKKNPVRLIGTGFF